jgi:hypothetical protein
MKESRSCSCGATIDIESSAAAVAFVLRYFLAVHSGPGHEPATRQQAANARRRDERRRLREEATR